MYVGINGAGGVCQVMVHCVFRLALLLCAAIQEKMEQEICDK